MAYHSHRPEVLVRHKTGYALAVGLAVGAGIIIHASTAASAGTDEIVRMTIQFDEMDDAGDGDLPLADEAAEKAMSNQNAGSGTVLVPSEEGSDKKDAGK
jgi:D-alanyl-D-alanine dipeptidase